MFFPFLKVLCFWQLVANDLRIYDNVMNALYFWDETKRLANLDKHGLDFSDADLVLESHYRLDIPSERNGERRVQSFAYVFEVLTVLTVVFLPDADGFRIISFRRANRSERRAYHEWLGNNDDDI